MLSNILTKAFSKRTTILLGALLSFSLIGQDKISGNIPNQDAFTPSLPDDFIEVGHARFSVLFWDIYDSRLLTKSGRYIPAKQALTDTAILFEITYLRDISQADLISNTIEQWQHLAIAATTYESYISELELVWPDISRGDTLSLFVKNHQSYFYHNQQFIGVIGERHRDPNQVINNPNNFADLFLSIWLSPQTSEPTLRQKLLNIKDS